MLTYKRELIVIKKLFWWILSGGALLSFFGGFFVFRVIKNIPDPQLIENRQVAQSTKIYNRTGEILLYEIHGEEKRTIIPFEEIPEHVKQATIAIEDAAFYEHPAFDWKSMIRALVVNLLKGKIAQGGSTITQQLAKNAFLTPERTLTRKIKEFILAIRLEKKYRKDEILNLYLNQIPYGANAYGIEAAAQTYFKKSAQELNVAEAALLAALPKAPTYYSPWGNNREKLMARKNYILDKMTELNFIDEKQQKIAKDYDFLFNKPAAAIKAPHFVMVVQDYLNNRYGEDFVRTAGLKVITALDWNIQEIAEKAALKGAARNQELYKGYNAALVAQDSTTGQILALVGSKDYFAPPEPENCQPGLNCKFEGNFNVAMQGMRQPGSAIKPFAYLTAFKKGLTPNTIVFDVPTEFVPDSEKCPPIVNFSNDSEECYHPQNFDEKFRGPVTLRQGLGQSINIPSAKVLYLAGIDNLLKLVKEFGIATLTERSRYGLSLVLGGGEVKLYELVNAYSVFAQEGIQRPPSIILKITDDRNRVLEEYRDQPRQIIEPQYARLINDILSDVETRAGLFSGSLNLTVFPNQEVALKTGTTNDYKDAWAIGYTKTLTAGVWAGNNDNSPMEEHGSSILAAVPIWSVFMSEVLKSRPPETFVKPEAVAAEKPILNGEYITRYQADGKEYPLIHNILFYVNKNNPAGAEPKNPETDPQFKNWEEAVLEWAKNNIPNFAAIYNQPLPENASLAGPTGLANPAGKIVIDWRSPANGNFIINNQILLEIQFNSEITIAKIDVIFNNQLLNSYSANFGKSYLLRTLLFIPKAELQNLLKIAVWDSGGHKTEKEIILYK
jgi:1A family penicillin-binding protein